MIVIEYGRQKNDANVKKHGISLAEAELFEWNGCTLDEDSRKDYGETRFLATGMIEGRLHVMVFTKRGIAVRVISLRKANTREQRKYAKAT